MSRTSPESAPSAQSALPILIAGAGIGGLATAIALARKGIASRVLERRSEFAEEGAGIQLGPNGTRALSALGLLEHLEPHAAKPEAIVVNDGATGRTLTTLPLGDAIAQRYGSPYWTAHRQDLHAVLLAAARSEPGIEIVQGFEVRSVKQASGGVTVSRGDGHASGTALVAADGLWSVIRIAAGFSTVEPVYAGQTAMRAVIPAEAAPHELRRPATHIWLRPDTHAVHYPVRAGREIAIVLIEASGEPPRTWASDVPAEAAAAAASRFPAPLRALVAAAPAWRKWGLYRLPVPDTLNKERIALLGDAAHPVLPFLAQGGVMALEDAVTISGKLAAVHDVTSALSGYSAQRRNRVARVAAQSGRNGAIYHMRGLMAAARNAALASLPPSMLMAQYDWLYGWRPD